MLAYRANRAKKVKELRAKLAQIQSEKDKNKRGESELARLTHLIPKESNNTTMVEALYLFAKESGLQQHEVMTEQPKQQSARRPGAMQDSSAVVKSSIKVQITGNYRQIAEYIRRVQNMERFNRIIDFKFVPGDDRLIKGNVTIETYSMAVKL